MASSGAEELRQPSQSTLTVQVRPAVVHVSNRQLASFPLQKRRLHTSASTDSVARPNESVGQNQLLCVSGTPTHCAFPPLTVNYPTVARPDSVWSAGVGCPNGVANIVASRSSHHSSVSLVTFHSPYQLEGTVLSYQPQCDLDSHRFRTGLLGKRAFSLHPAVYPICPSPPKATSHKSTEIAPPNRTMPSNESSPWGTSMFKGSSNGTVQPAATHVPVFPGQRPSNQEKPSSTTCPAASSSFGNNVENCRMDPTLAHPNVPMQKCQNVILPDLSRVEQPLKDKNITVGNGKAVNGMPQSPNSHQMSEVLNSKRSVSSRVIFTEAVRKLAASGARMKNGAAKEQNICSAPGPVLSFVPLSAGDGARETFPCSDGNSSPAESTALCLGHICQELQCVPSDALRLPALDGGYRCKIDGLPPSPHGGTAKPCAIPHTTECEFPQQPSIYSVTTQISAIHLTTQNMRAPLQEIKSSTHSLPEEHSVTNKSVLGLKDDAKLLLDAGEEEEQLPDELENHCSGGEDDGSDCSSMNDASSTASMVILSNVEEPGTSEVEDNRVEKPALVPSLFPFIPPTLYFGTVNEKVAMLPPDQRKLLKWKMSSVTPNVVKHTISRSHFKATKKSHDWLGCWGHHMKSPGFKEIREYQKLNHFPGSFQIGRKDRLWRNLSKMQVRFGKREFGFFPRTFVLPQDIKLLRKAWEDGGSRQKWIIKPPASARGIGIQVIHKWSQMPRRRPLLVQKYLHKPYLIGGNKFDLRIYVYVSSYDPLRIYIFNDGLVRFASCKYSSSMKSLGNKFMHLTNYSVNKKNSEYQSNSDDKACQGHKWALKALWQHLGQKGVNTTHLWEKIKDIVIKTIIVSDPYVNMLLKMHVRSPYSCHELFGFDIMLDENLKPWVLEVNISPSLHSSTALDVAIKSQMIRDVLNLAGFVLPHHEDLIQSCSTSTSSFSGEMRERSRQLTELSSDEKIKRAFFLRQPFADQEFFSSVLDILTPGDVRVLAESEDELCRRGEFERVFPSPTSSRYMRFFEQPRYLNILLNQWEQKYWQNRSKGISLLKNLCQAGVHLGPTSEPTHLWSSRFHGGQKCEVYGNFPPMQESVRSSVVVTRRVASLTDEDFETPSPTNIGLGSWSTSICSSLDSESLQPGESV
ncbi:tubulin monoglutamylase TTLL4 isoform X1 [Scleropages formosus]|uniref:tubulin monoglutamylase TTLL4 isoform X1 n=1 Tax=Scleropages formosus TaxID=113540 RepID=UPI0010FA6975|nr:tubulin polyglutamylase TTLL4 isoform X1 [Scleropages formosus]XP_018585217.2 tubulin polyglutamylase TTLL4 isoform X1 [Scleropages formosus]XP_018585218.2 tubulin polyglutamylase TTLL4 isoform X1 [Scleropages formosus]